MKQSRRHSLVNCFSLVSLTLAIVLVAAFSSVSLHHNVTDAASKPTVGAPVPSQFSFTGAPGWRQGATNKASMALFHNAHDCFTSAQYDTGTVDAPATLRQYEDGLTASGYTVTPVNIQTLTLQTSEGAKRYQLQQYAVSGDGSASAPEGGQEIGYLQLTSGYVKVEGDCDTTSELPATIPALQAVRFDAAE